MPNPPDSTDAEAKRTRKKRRKPKAAHLLTEAERQKRQRHNEAQADYRADFNAGVVTSPVRVKPKHVAYMRRMGYITKADSEDRKQVALVIAHILDVLESA